MILLGAPGCGKGTHGVWLGERLGVPQISTGDILRAAVSADTALGREARRYMDSGQLVPDALILDLMRARLAQADADAGFILDGFPRTLPQAEGLEQVLGERRENLDWVLLFVVSREELIRRITRRRVCPACAAVYNLDFRPPQPDGTCARCGAAVVQREDDLEATVVQRLDVYERQTAPLIAYYERRPGLLVRVDGDPGYESARAQIESHLAGPGGG